jgi:DJ-1/PfpI family
MDRFGIGITTFLVTAALIRRRCIDAFMRRLLPVPVDPAIVKNDIYRVFFDMIRVTVVEIDGCMASSAAITHDVMATANRIGAATKRALPFEVTTVRCGPRRSRAQLRGTQLVIIPGLGTWSADALDGKLKSSACRRAGDMLVAAFESGAALAASCASTFLLAEARLLDGRRATTTWWLAPLFRDRYPEVELVTDRMVVADWPIATGGAAMAQMDLMLAVVDRFAGPGLPRACANYLLLDGCATISPATLRCRSSPTPSRWRPGRLPAGSPRPAASHLFSSFSGSELRHRDICWRPRVCPSKKSPDRWGMRSLPPFGG